MTRSAKTTPRTRHTFLKQMLKNPVATGGIKPSSRVLARMMVKELAPGREWVVELGPGTGVFTEELLAQGLPADRLLLLEANAAFIDVLSEKFPKVRIIHGDARNLAEILQTVGQPKISKIVSGLPFKNFTPELRAAITSAIGEVLEEGGTAVQFTYALTPPFPAGAAKKAKLSGKRKGFVVANLPPAFVWRYEKTA